VAFTFRDLGRRLHDLGVQHEDLGARQINMADGSKDDRRTGIALDQMLDEELALQKLILTMRPETLEDAAVQIGILFLSLNHLDASDLGNEACSTASRKTLKSPCARLLGWLPSFGAWLRSIRGVRAARACLVCWLTIVRRA
jgi:hypothetical protein